MIDLDIGHIRSPDMKPNRLPARSLIRLLITSAAALAITVIMLRAFPARTLAGVNGERRLPHAGIDPRQEHRGILPESDAGLPRLFFLRLQGYEQVRRYDGAWAEWRNDPDMAAATGLE